MKTINIAPFIKEYTTLNIFDDPEYCEAEADEAIDCPRLDQEGYCKLFFDKNGNWEALEFDYDAVKMRKCDQCKKAYQAYQKAHDPVKIQERIDDDFFDENYS